MKKQQWIIFLLILVIANFQKVSGQVNATYDKTDSTLTIVNTPNRPFIIFSNHVNREELLFNNSFQFSPEDMVTAFCGVDFPINYQEITGIKVFYSVKEAPPTFVFYYYEEGTPIIIKESDKREINVEIAETPKKEKPAPTKTTTTPAVAKKAIINPYTDMVNDFLSKSNKLLQRKKEWDYQESINLQNKKLEAQQLKKEIENYMETLWEKKNNTKTKCEDCDILIKSSQTLCSNLEKLSSRIVNALKKVSDQVVIGWKMEFRDLILQPVLSSDSAALLKIRKEIDTRSQHPLWGWIGLGKVNHALQEVKEHYNKILIESKIFILQKQSEYEDENDKAVIEDLQNDIPEMYDEIPFYKDSLSRIEIPIVKLTILGIVVLMLLAGITFYIRIILKNKKIEKKKQEKTDSYKGGLLIEEDDVIEVITYTVNMADIKERKGIDYLEINMLDMVDNSTIRNVYMSREAILKIHKFFSEFFKANGKANETGCFLVGRWEYVEDSNQQVYDISIEDIVAPGDDAIYGEYNLNFGAKIGITLNYAIENKCETTGNEYVHTAWMHTHPGLGLFLSNQDLSVQSQLAHSQHPGRLLAIVMDSATPDLKMAFFTPQKTGTMNNDKNLKKLLSLQELTLWAKKTIKKPNQKIKNNHSNH
ncbi:MAG: hypothetical protein FWH59_00750 [Lentimicrobiaceae bacterium]|nr:hypothetical protein [Lentimicrobiaceae bacterium]